MRRLKADRIDLMQIRRGSFAPAIRSAASLPVASSEALQAAQKTGKIRYIGFTGHKDPDYHLAAMIERAREGLHVRRGPAASERDGRALKSFEKKVLPVLRARHRRARMKSPRFGRHLEEQAATAVECLITP